MSYLSLRLHNREDKVTYCKEEVVVNEEVPITEKKMAV